MKKRFTWLRSNKNKKEVEIKRQLKKYKGPLGDLPADHLKVIAKQIGDHYRNTKIIGEGPTHIFDGEHWYHHGVKQEPIYDTFKIDMNNGDMIDEDGNVTDNISNHSAERCNNPAVFIELKKMVNEKNIYK